VTDTKPKGEPTVRDPSKAVVAMGKNWTILDDLMEGTLVMRNKREAYLPQEEAESVEAYEARLERTFLYDGLSRSIKHLVGKAFSNALTFDGMNASWEDWFKNIDLCGMPIQMFAQEAFKSALKYGHAGLFIDYPNMPPNATLADEKRLNARPYLSLRHAPSILGWRTGKIENLKTFTRVRLLECRGNPESEWDDDGEVEVVRVLEQGSWTTYEEDADGNWLVSGHGTTSPVIDIPLVPIYFDKDHGLLCSIPPLMPIAFTNVAHWQSQSDQRNILRVARVPMLFGSGIDPEKFEGEMTIGSNRMVCVSEAEADLKFVEHTGAAIQAGQTDLENLEDQMATFSAEKLMTSPGNTTATASAIGSRDSTSPLGLMCDAFEEGFNRAFELMAEFAGLDSSPKMQMSRDFGIIGNTSDLDALSTARGKGDIDRKTYLVELKRRGVLAENTDIDKVVTAAENEGPQPGDLPPGSPGAQPGAGFGKPIKPVVAVA
jgi:hypothetical protein